MKINEQREMLRHAVMECLVLRHPAALPVQGIVRRVRTEVDFVVDPDEVAGALAMLEGLGLVKSQYDELGSSKWWSATAAGLLREERST